MIKFVLALTLILFCSQAATGSPCKTTFRKIIGQGRTCGCTEISSSYSVQKCQRECKKDENCVALTYVNGTCYSCETAGGTTSMTNSQHFMIKRCVSCPGWHTSTDFRAVGASSTTLPKLERCLNTCKRNENCTGISAVTSPFECLQMTNPAVELVPEPGTNTSLITNCGENEFLYTTENQLEGENETFRFSMALSTDSFLPEASFLDVMFEAQNFSEYYEFTAEFDLANEATVTTINGREQDFADEKFWAFLIRSSEGDCLIPVGVNRYFPASGEEIVLSYKTFDIFDKLPNCWVTGPSDEFGITYTIENSLEDFPPLFNYTIPLDMCIGENFFSGMQKAAALDDNFQFNSTNFGVLGETIDAINGLAANNTVQTFWSFRSRTATGDDCLMAVGVSSKIPFEGEHVVFSYSFFSIVSELPQCDGGDSSYDDI